MKMKWWGKPLAFLVAFIILLLSANLWVDEGTASWYSVESCKREGTSGIMANGKELKDEELTCASWNYPLGTVLYVTNIENSKRIRVVVTDRGPTKKLFKEGRIIDLSKRAFSKLALLKQGIIKVKVEESK